MSARRGVTLIELIVVIALIGVLAGVTGLAIRRTLPPNGIDTSVALALAARDSAVRTGRTVTVRIPASKVRPAMDVTAYPDGRVLGEEALGIDRLSGRPADAPH